MTQFINFSNAIKDAKRALRHTGVLVDTGRWQGVPTEGKPDLMTMEVLNWSCSVPMNTSMHYTAMDIEPNLPWAEDHFQERVGGVPMNPDPSYEHWPWAAASKKALTLVELEVSEGSWAYLAGMIDGDGSISMRSEDKHYRRPRVQVHQRDREFLKLLSSQFHSIGRFNRSPKTSGFGSEMSAWVITRKEELLWVLPHIIPYLRIKNDKAEEALALVKAQGTTALDKPLVSVEPRFTHTYSERFWARGHGIHYPYGDLNDVIDLLARDSYTRQAYLPIFFPEDTGAVHGGRIPCTLGYHFMLRGNSLHMWYEIRSCDYVRHLRDDLYMAVRLCQHVGSQLEDNVYPGTLHFLAHSLHYHQGDAHLL